MLNKLILLASRYLRFSSHDVTATSSSSRLATTKSIVPNGYHISLPNTPDLVKAFTIGRRHRKRHHGHRPDKRRPRRFKMGQENSVVSDDTPPNTLSERSLEAVANHIKSGQCRRILVMTGAGISTAAGSKF